jgi:hypothetical protein
MSPVLSYLDIDQNKARPMTEEECRLFMECVFAEKRELETKGKLEAFTEEISKECGAVGQIFEKRLSWPACVSQQCAFVSVPCALFVLSLAGGSPGKIVMWAYTINRMYQRKRDLITMDDLSLCFPWGFPTEPQEHELWDAQKGSRHGVKCDNMVDQIETWFLDPYKPVEIVHEETNEGQEKTPQPE